MVYLSYICLILLLSYWLAMPAREEAKKMVPTGAYALDDWLKKFSWGRGVELRADFKIPPYKFYSEIVELVLDIARRFGGVYEENLHKLREGLEADHQFEVKCKDLIKGAWWQICIMFLITWAFIVSSLSILQMPIPFQKLALLISWQLVGMIALPWIIHRARRYYFGDVGVLWKTLFMLKALVSVPLSRSEIFLHAELFKLKDIKNKRLKSVIDHILDCCQRALREGGSYEDEVNKIAKDLRFEENRIYGLFEKRLVVLKLAILSIFFLPTYLAFIYIILSDFITLM
jgi:hypothetical protein